MLKNIIDVKKLKNPLLKLKEIKRFKILEELIKKYYE